ncbi:ADOP family duplicated permease [Acidicapsa dinghuensis]|uniref:ADOP family duplicated permease n=1 Tax=Acidicapsa dinghuensis TaxID=2218256 RepID=A0ABW1ELP0_9BACT|nr:ABC transporter permease [Acidicapsa dinghuensis]
MFHRKQRSAEDFAEEIRSHLAIEADQLASEGTSQQEAARRARVAFGNKAAAQERFRLRGRIVWFENLRQDLRFAARTMFRNPGFTVLAILTLALGIAVSTTAFTWIDAVLLQPLSGVADPSRLVTLESIAPDGSQIPNSYPDYIDFRDRLKLLSGVAVTRPNAFTVTQSANDGRAERVWGELVSGNFFAVLGVQPQLGRVFTPAEYADTPNAFPLVVISDRFWRSHFHADPAAIGQTLRVNQHPLTIIGVAPPAFHGSMPVTAYDLWIPYMQQPILNGVQEWMLRDRHNRNMLGIVRLAPGVTLPRARAELDSLARYMAVANADVSEGMTATLLPLWQSPHGPQGLLVGPLRILMAVSLLVLLIVCANVANLLLARATAREKEFTARLALGAGRFRLVRQLLTESLLLAALGSALGLAATPLLAHGLKLLMPPSELSSLLSLNTQLNGRILAFTLGLCCLAALAAGLAPALQVSRMNLSAKLNDGGRSGSAGRAHHRLRSTLVCSEVALALVALAGAGLFSESFRQTLHIDPGFSPDHVLLSRFYLNTAGYSLQQRKEFCRRLETAMLSAPGVTNVAYSDGVPLGFEPSWWEELDIQGYARTRGENMNIFRNVISPGYLDLMHIPIVAGRNFTAADTEQTQPVMIVSQAFVHRFFANRNPLGAQVHGWGKWFRIVGVAQDSKYHYLNEPATPYFYVDFRQLYREDESLAFYVRTKGDPDTALAVLRAQTHAIDPNVNVFDSVPLAEFIGASLYPQRVAASLMTVLGSIAVLLAAVGLYGVMAFSVAQRTQEIGVRMALGAEPRHVQRMILRQSLALTLFGLAAGLLLTLALTQTVSSITVTNSAQGASTPLLANSANPAGSTRFLAALFNPTHLAIYTLSAIFLCGITCIAAWLPARRASHIDPMEALRCD